MRGSFCWCISYVEHNISGFNECIIPPSPPFPQKLLKFYFFLPIFPVFRGISDYYSNFGYIDYIGETISWLSAGYREPRRTFE